MRILIAEDDLVSRKLLHSTLTRWGFETVICVDGKEALAVLKSPETPEIAILDWMMPELDGPEVCRQVRAFPSAHPKYIILLTAKAQREDLIAGLQAGADDYVTKPFDPRELRARLNVGIRLISLQKDLAEKVEALQVAVARLGQVQQSQKLEAIGRLASGVAHEINTPTQYIGDNIRFLEESWKALSPAVQFLSELPGILRSDPDPAELASRIEVLLDKSDIQYALKEIPSAVSQSLEGIHRVTRIVHAMRDFSHPSSEQKSPLDLNHTIETTIMVCRNEWKYAAEVKTCFGSDLPQVPCLATEIQQVILILLVNATHAIADVVGKTGTLGTITVSTSMKDGFAEIRVSDTGSGIPEQARDKVFEPFFTTKEIGKGTGQGLAIARSVIVEQHGGSIWFETETGKGTTFIIHLPLDVKKDRSNEHNYDSQSTPRR